MNPAGETRDRWWRNAVFYEVYVRSFADGNADGVGDLPGVRARLPYLAELGVDAIWLTPFYRSPMADGGYDVADHCDVDPIFGTLADFDAVLSDAHKLGLRVTVDLVPNHSSAEHRWFIEAVLSAPGSDARRRYHFRAGNRVPNNWESDFGGPAWTRSVNADGSLGEWYLHLFAPEQPDFDWSNPEVHHEFERVLRFWLDRGVDGFRVDVAHGLVKAAGLPDNPPRGLLAERPGYLPVGHQWDQPGVHAIFRRWRIISDSYPGDRMLIGEAWVDGQDALARYVRPDELHQAFNFAFLQTSWVAGDLRCVITDCLRAARQVGSAPTWVLSNHDVVRHLSRYGDGHRGWLRARSAILLILALPGAVYLYQGEELGLPEVELPSAALRDPTWERSGRTRRGRDGARVPIPWTGDRPGWGFTEPGVTPWLPMPAGWERYAADGQSRDESSMLCLYRLALRIRSERWWIASEELRWCETSSGMLTFRRGRLLCATNFGPDPVAVPTGARLLLRSTGIENEPLEQDCTGWWLQPGDGSDSIADG